MHAGGMRWRRLDGGWVFAPDPRDEAVAPARDIDDEAAGRSVVSQRTAERLDVRAQIGVVDERFWPRRRYQLVLADDLSGVIDQREKKIESAAAKIDGSARRDQLAPPPQQLERIKRQLLVGNGFHESNIALRQSTGRTLPSRICK
jgi:hypothetical protein